MAKQADITLAGNRLTLSGELDFSNVMSLLAKSTSLCLPLTDVVIDFSQLKNSNSAGLALMIEWIKLAKAHQKRITFDHVSTDLISIAKVSGLYHIIASECK